MGTNNGLTLDGPFSCNLIPSVSISCNPPMPDPTLTPTLNGSSFVMSIFDCSKASFAAQTAYCENVDILFAVLNSICSFATNPFTSAASLTSYSDVSNLVILSIPHFPSLTLFQNSSTLFPIGVIAPIPVTTTRLLIFTLHSDH